MNHLVEILVPMGAFALVFGIIFISVTARNRERMALIENGADPKLFKPDPKYKMFNTLRNALLLIGIGLGLFIAVMIMETTSMDNEGIAFALILLFGGSGLLTAYLLRKKVIKNEKSDQE